MVRIPAGTCAAGATEAHYEAYLQQSTMNFPGMAEAVRKQFMIPPAEAFGVKGRVRRLGEGAGRNE